MHMRRTTSPMADDKNRRLINGGSKNTAIKNRPLNAVSYRIESREKSDRASHGNQGRMDSHPILAEQT